MPKRKAAPKRERKDEMLRIRVTAEQKAVLEVAAQRDGLDLSAWLRRLALRAAGVLGR